MDDKKTVLVQQTDHSALWGSIGVLGVFFGALIIGALFALNNPLLRGSLLARLAYGREMFIGLCAMSIMALAFMIGILGAVHDKDAVRHSLVNSIKENYGVSSVNMASSSSGDDIPNDHAEMKLTDSKGKKHDCFYEEVKSTSTSERYYVQCLNASGILTPGETLR